MEKTKHIPSKMNDFQCRMDIPIQCWSVEREALAAGSSFKTRSDISLHRLSSLSSLLVYHVFPSLLLALFMSLDAFLFTQHQKRWHYTGHY